MQTNIAKSRKNRILLFILTLVMLILTGVVFRRTWLNEQNTATLTSQLATAQAVGWETELLREQAVLKTDISRSRELAAQSSLVDSQDASLKVLLAVESLKALNGVNISNQYPTWTLQSLYDSLSNIGGYPLTGQQGTVYTMAFSPDGNWLATGSDNATIFLRSTQAFSDKPIILQLDKSSWLFRLKFSPNGKWLSVGTAKGIVYLWDTNDLKAKPIVLSGNTRVAPMVFSADGKWLVTVSSDNKIPLLWDMQDLSAQPIALHGSDKYGCYDLTLSPNNRTLACGGYDGSAYLWDLQDLKAKPFVVHKFGGAQELAFSPDGKWLAGNLGGHTVNLWDATQKIDKFITLNGHTSAMSMLTFSPDGKWLATGGDSDHKVLLWDMTNPGAESIVLSGHGSFINGLAFTGMAFNPNGKQLTLADNEGMILIWDVENPVAKPKILRCQTGGISTLAFSPDGKILAAGGCDNVVRLWDTRHPTVESTPLTGNDQSAGLVKFSPNGKWLAMSSEDGTARVWNMQTPSAMPIVLSGFETQWPRLIFSQDNNWLVAGGGRLRLWRTQSLTATPTILGEKDERYYYTMALSPDTNWLAAKPANGPIRLWNMKKLSEPPVLLEYESSDNLFWYEVFDLSFSPDGRWLAAACGDELVRLWDMQNLKSQPVTLSAEGFSDLDFSLDGKWLAAKNVDPEITHFWNMQNPSADPIVLPDAESLYKLLAFSPDGKWYAQQSQPHYPNFFVALWDMQHPTSKPNLLLNMNQGEIRTLVFSPSGKWLAANSWDEAFYLWDMQNLKGAPLLLHGYGRDTFAIAFSPDEQWLATVGKENSVRLWQMNLKDLAARACQYAGRNLTRAEWGWYAFEEPYRATCPEWSIESEPTPIP